MDPALAPMSVGDGVERLALRTPTLPPATHTNSYFVGRGDFYVVEPGSPWDDAQALLHGAVERRVARGDRLLGAIVTHHHVDHVGGARAFCDAFHVPLVAHPITRDKLRGALHVDVTLDEGERLDPALDDLDLAVLHTPGHAPGHLCLHARRDGWMIVGDMVASIGTILIDPTDDGDMDAYLTQLGRLASLRPTRLLPAHGDPIDDAVARLEFYVTHRLAREARVLNAVGDGPTPLDVIAAGAYADAPDAPSFLTERSSLAHLARLEKLGRVTSAGDGSWRRVT